MKTIYLAGGCFWGVQKYFDQFDGVQATEVGYAKPPPIETCATAVDTQKLSKSSTTRTKSP